jgi:AcrR family transcriptional regulator
MRIKDDKKQEALFLATIKLVNEIGFAASSVAKIAGEAGVSPATLYIYFRNKEDLLVSTYLAIKRDMSVAVLDGLDETQPVRDILHNIWLRMFAHISLNKAEFRYAEQFANSPFKQLVDKQEVHGYFAPLIRVIQRGIDQKIIKDVPFEILAAFMFHPVMTLANQKVCTDIELDSQDIEISFQMSWDAIKL